MNFTVLFWQALGSCLTKKGHHLKAISNFKVIDILACGDFTPIFSQGG